MLRIGSAELASPVLLAPIAGYCDMAFRLVVRGVTGMQKPGFALPAGIGPDRLGVGLACTDLLCPQAVLRESEKAMWLAATCPEDQPVCMQLYGREPSVMAEAARWAEAHGAVTIDINMGCPVDKVTKKNGGSKLLCEPEVAVAVTRAVVGAVSVPVTVKIRLGWSAQSLITSSLPPRLADCGISGITVHGRTTEQKFSGRADLSGIARVVEVLASWPEVCVIGNGDIGCAADAAAMMAKTGCDGVMIGRAALGQPWLLRDAACLILTGREHPPLPRADRVRLVLRHFDLLNHYRGSTVAVNTIRQRVARYSAHLQPWPGLRRVIRELDSVDAVRELFLAAIEQLEADPHAVIESAGRDEGRSPGLVTAVGRQNSAG